MPTVSEGAVGAKACTDVTAAEKRQRVVAAMAALVLLLRRLAILTCIWLLADIFWL